jgi:hypothetical protein
MIGRTTSFAVTTRSSQDTFVPLARRPGMLLDLSDEKHAALKRLLKRTPDERFPLPRASTHWLGTEYIKITFLRSSSTTPRNHGCKRRSHLISLPAAYQLRVRSRPVIAAMLDQRARTRLTQN